MTLKETGISTTEAYRVLNSRFPSKIRAYTLNTRQLYYFRLMSGMLEHIGNTQMLACWVLNSRFSSEIRACYAKGALEKLLLVEGRHIAKDQKLFDRTSSQV